MKSKRKYEMKKKITKWNFMIEENKKYYQPFEFEVSFKVGRIANNFLFFDSFINYCALLYILKDYFFNLSYDFDEKIKLELPIKKIFFDKDKFFYTIGIINNQNNNKTAMVTKKTMHPTIPIIKDKRVRINAGNLKNYKMSILYSTKKIYRIYGMGNITLLKKIIPEKCNIGKKSSIGFGETEINIKPINSFALYNREKKRYIRPIPIEYIKKNNLPMSNEIMSLVHAPYYGYDAKYYECCY